MLILSRNPRQKIIIGDDIKIIYLGTDGRGRVRIGIEAPSDVKVLREEIIIVNEEESSE